MSGIEYMQLTYSWARKMDIDKMLTEMSEAEVMEIMELLLEDYRH